MKHIDIYTDGACKGNPGPGGFCAILVFGKYEKTVKCGYFSTTNNRMELRAAIAGLEALKEPCDVTLYSDSRYLVESMDKNWVRTWQSHNWIKSDRKKALNVDLWEKLLLLDEIHDIKFVWVKGHDGHEYNERCDKNAVECAENPTEYDKEEK